MDITYEWRGASGNGEINELHAEAFETRVFSDDEWNWVDLTARHSLGGSPHARVIASSDS